MNYDLEERTAVFGENVIDFIKTLKQNVINNPLINQFIRSATSIGANYCEANNATQSVISKIKYLFARKKLAKLSIGSEWLSEQIQTRKKNVKYYGKKRRSLL